MRRQPGSRVLTLVALSGCLAPLSEAAAQVRIGVSGGISNPSGDFADHVDRGVHLRGALRFGVPLFPLSVQAEGEVHRFPGADDGSVNVTGASLGAVLSLGGVGIAPYILGGVGIYRTGDSDDVPGLGGAGSDRGFFVGGGMDLEFLDFGGFVEVRFVKASRDGPVDTQWVPVSVGVRF